MCFINEVVNFSWMLRENWFITGSELTFKEPTLCFPVLVSNGDVHQMLNTDLIKKYTDSKNFFTIYCNATVFFKNAYAYSNSYLLAKPFQINLDKGGRLWFTPLIPVLSRKGRKKSMWVQGQPDQQSKCQDSL